MKIKTGSLLKITRKLLNKRKRTFRSLSRETGLGYFWLIQVAAGNVGDPGVNRIQFLYEHLTGKKLLRKVKGK